MTRHLTRVLIQPPKVIGSVPAERSYCASDSWSLRVLFACFPLLNDFHERGKLKNAESYDGRSSGMSVESWNQRVHRYSWSKPIAVRSSVAQCTALHRLSTGSDYLLVRLVSRVRYSMSVWKRNIVESIKRKRRRTGHRINRERWSSRLVFTLQTFGIIAGAVASAMFPDAASLVAIFTLEHVAHNLTSPGMPNESTW